MKILVDEMPKKPSDCPYSNGNSFSEKLDKEGRTCLLRTLFCTDTKKCPVFKAITKE